MFYEEQIESGSAFSEYLHAQILKISRLGVNHGGAFVGLMCETVCPKKAPNTSLPLQVH